MQLKTVVLPAPLGPMMAKTSLSITDSDTPSTASKPPKRIDRSETGSNVVLVVTGIILATPREDELPAPSPADHTASPTPAPDQKSAGGLPQSYVPLRAKSSAGSPPESHR